MFDDKYRDDWFFISVLKDTAACTVFLLKRRAAEKDKREWSGQTGEDGGDGAMTTKPFCLSVCLSHARASHTAQSATSWAEQ